MTAVLNLFHYTDRDGWNAIRSQQPWRFRVSQPIHPDRPLGAYFTDIEPSAMNLRVLHKKLRIPKTKQEFVFWFTGSGGLSQLNDGQGRDKRIYFSSTSYEVARDRQRFGDLTVLVREQFT